MKIQNSFTDKETIESHFTAYPAWKELFLKHFGEYDPITYLDKAWELLNDNGYSLVIKKRYSNNPKSSLYVAIEELVLHREGIDDYEIYDVNESQMHEVMLNIIILSSVIDFKTWK